jgi:hypothetical protein
MAGEADFESRIPAESLEVLLDLGAELGFDPTSSAEMESYLVELLSQSPGPGTSLSEWLRPRIETAFRSIAGRPEWIQNPDWQVGSGRPMWFIGQIGVPADAGLFHDEAMFYVFWDPESGVVRSVVQVS